MTGRDADGTFARHKFDFLQEISRQTKAKEEYIWGAEAVKSVGIYYSEPSMLEAASRDEAEVISRVIVPVARETPDNYIGWYPLPPGGTSRHPALTVRSFESGGRAIFSGAPLTWFIPHLQSKYAIHLDWPAGLLKGVIEEFGINPGISHNGPSVLEAVAFMQSCPGRDRASRNSDIGGEDRRLIVHLLNQSTGALGGEAIPIRNVMLQIRKSLFDAYRAFQVYPDDRELSVSDEGAPRLS